MAVRLVASVNRGVARGLFMLAWILAAAAIAAIGGCTDQAAPVSRDSPIRIAVPMIPPAIGNPYQGITIPSTLALQAVFDTVTSIDADGNPIPALAVSWKQESPKSWVFTLRPDVVFSNGEPLTAEALVDSAHHMNTLQGRGETIGSTLAQIARAERIDDRTVRVVLSEPDPLLPLHVSVWRIPAPAQWRTLTQPGDEKDAVGSGPYIITDRRDGRLTLKANPRAWRKPQATGLDIVMISDTTARLQAFVSGAVDMALGLGLDDRPVVERTGGTIVTRMTPQVDLIAFLTERRASTPLKDPRVRRALNMAVDRALITSQILAGKTTPASQLNFPGAFGYDAALTPIPYDPAGAKALLAQAGYPDGLSLTMMVTTGEVAGDTLYYQQIASDLKAVGVDVEIRSRPAARQLQDLFAGRLQDDMFSWDVRGTDPITAYRHRSCLTPSPARMPFHCDPALTPLVRAARDESDLDRRKQLYGRIAAYERANPPGIILWQRPEFDAVSAGIEGYAPVQDVLHLDTIRRAGG